MVTRLSLPAIGLMLCTELALASPTSNEYLKCHHMAAATLTACLDQAPGQAPKKCWVTSERANRHCYRAVQLDHQPDRARREAAQKAVQAEGLQP